jgi:hypothetical protein
VFVYNKSTNYQEFLWHPKSHKISCGIVNSSPSRADEKKEAAKVMECVAPVIDQSH